LYHNRGSPSPIESKAPGVQRLYDHLRHPILLGFLLIAWTTPIMTLDHFFLAFALSSYLLLANGIDSEDIRFVESQLASGMKHVIESKPKSSSAKLLKYNE
jgi:hypothetical protein